MKKMLYLLCIVGALFAFSGNALAQSARHWEIAKGDFNIPKNQLLLGQLPETYKFAVLDVPALYQELSTTASSNASPLRISIPTPEGNFAEFFLTETSVISPEAASLYTIKTFKGYAKNAQQVTIRCDISPTGFHAAIFHGDISYVVEPVSKGNVSQHIAYYKSDLHVPGLKCGFNDTHRKSGYKPSPEDETPKTPTNLRTYRLAIIADATYRTQFGGMPYNATTVLNSFASGLNMVNAVYERDLGVHLTLVSNAACANAVLTDHTDIDEVHAFIVTSSGLGSGGFDIGHSLLWSNTGGVAYLGVVCNNSLKGGGFSGATGSVTQLYVDYMAHELGHQFGAVHTFASQECGTSEANFRYEPGEGSTIMAYAGVCGVPPSYQNFSDPYFHAASIAQINTYISVDGTCAAISTPGTGNNAAPTANAQSDITIPKQTPFILVGSGTDANSDPVSFSWEQFNGAGTSTTGSPNCTSTTQPLFRFRPPVSDNYRVFPQMSDVLAGNNNTPAWEKLPCVARTLNFRLTARDNNTNWGRTASDNVVVTVANTGPFDVTAPNGAESWAANSSQTVTWTVNGTDGHCTNVDVLISTDNGVTYTVLGTFPNNGSATVTMPNTPSTSARVLVQCSVGGNFRSASTFFDVSNAVFTITTPPPCPDVRISQVYGGGGNASAPYTHDFIEIYNGGSTTVNLSGYSVQYAAAAGTSWTTANLSGTIAPGKYYLVRLATGGANGVALPTPDATGTMNMAVAAGKVALVSSTTALTGACPSGAQIIDFVGYGTAANCSESANGPAHSNTTAILRANNGCTDNNNNSTDFATGAPTPRNSASPVNNCGLVLTITDNVCPSTTGTISGNGCGAGTVLEYATNEAGPWSTTAPTYTTSAITVYVRCRNTTTSCSGPIVSGMTAPTPCVTCPTLTTPGEVQITNSTCTSNCTVTGGNILAPTMGCPTGSSIQYSTDGGTTWSLTLPTYNTTGPAQTIKTRCRCDADPNIVTPASTGVTTIPGTCTTPAAPTGTLTIVNSTCNGCTPSGGSIAIGTVSGTGGTLQYSTDGGTTWNAALPTYNQSGPAQTIIASVLAANGCRSNTTQVGQTTPATCAGPSAPTGTLAIVNSTCSNCALSGGSIAIGTVSGTGGTLEYSTDGGTTWNAALPTYNQSGPAQTILASVLDINGCRSTPTQVGQTTPGTCTTPSAPTGTLSIVNSTCSNCTVSGGSIAIGTVSGTGGTLQYSTDGGTTWNAALPTYNQTGPAQTILASVLGANGCRSGSTQVGQTTPGTCTTPSAPTGTLAITNSTCTNCVLGGGSIAIGTVSGTGGTIQYSTDGGTTWNAALPTYNQTGPAQTILASVLGANGCRSGSTTVGMTSPGNCDNQMFTTYYVDADGDNYGTGPGQLFCTNPGPGFALQAGDCNDNAIGINPGATEICDGIDNNCNGTVDDVGGNTTGNWNSADVGQANGSSNFPPCGAGPDDIFTLNATGFSTSSSDKLHAVYQELCGNGEIIAHVLNVSGGGWAGITLRETLAPGSKKVGLKTQFSSNIRREIRTTTNGAASILNLFRPAHTWLRLVRNGSNFVGYTSTNGVTWDFAFSTTIPMSGCIYAGLFAESINNAVTTTATFDNVSIVGGTHPLGANVQGITPALDGLTVSVYPNPGNGEMTLSVNGAPERNLQLEVTNALGRIVRNIALPEGAVFTYPLDLSSEPAGVYYLRLRSEHGVGSVQRVVVQE